MSVFVLDTNKKPQNPVHPAKARLLLTEGKASVFRKESGSQYRNLGQPVVPVLQYSGNFNGVGSV